MKNQGHSAIVIAACASVFCLAAAHAQSNQPQNNQSNQNYQTVTPPVYYESAPVSRFYVGADVGGVLTGDTKVKEFLGPVDPGTKVSLDPGIRVGFVGGYKLTDWFSLEGETGVTGNNIHSITGASIDGNATLANVPLLLNARLQLPPRRCPVTPYIGGGAGGAASILAFDHHIDFNGTDLHGSDADMVFAYQAFAGLRYAINDHMGVGVEYHYLATTGPTWSADLHGAGGPDHISFAGTQSHAITASFDYQF
jgi:opacity protein-like surface antigen